MADNTIVDKKYISFLTEVKSHIHTTQIKLARVVNKELIRLYWWLGSQIVDKQDKYGWGKSIVERLSYDLRKTFAGETGFSTQNLWYMRQFYLEYKDYPNLQQLVGDLPWGHNLIILSKIKDLEERQYYIKTCLEMGWSRNVLINQIKSEAYTRHALTDKQHNFHKALPKHLAEQADQSMKDLYMLDILGITKPVLEVELESRMVNKIKDVMLELGYGFSFIGNQYRITQNGKEYFIDLLFYNRKLKALVAMELKTGKFKPEYAGKMNFYLNLLDDFVKEEWENPSIGIILCSERDRFEVEYALRGIHKPVGVSEFQLTKKLPKELSGKLPDAKKLEEEIKREMELDIVIKNNIYRY